MAFEHDSLSRLPEPPAPSPARRRAAIANALDAFEKKYRTRFQAPARHLRLMQQTAIPPSRRRAAMPRARHLIAASLVVLMAGSAGWLYLVEFVEPRAAQQPLMLKADRLNPTKIVERPGPSNTSPSTGTGLAYAPQSVAPGPVTAGLEQPKVQQPVAEARRVAPTYWLRPETRGNADRLASVGIAPPEPMPPAEPIGRDRFVGAAENAFKVVREAPVSTFSIDVDTASYSFVRASLNRNVLPQPAAVRIEEMINYFPYDYAAPATRERAVQHHGRGVPEPVVARAASSSASASRAMRCSRASAAARQPGVPDRHLGLDERAEPAAAGQAVAGACCSTQLTPNDRVAIVTYAGNAGTALEPTAGGREGEDPARVIERLEAGGSTAGAEGIRQAYALAEQNFDPNGVNRVILATDGDFNVGITNQRRAQGLRRARARQGHLPLGARLRHGQLQRRADADAGPERQRRRRLHRHAQRGPQGAGRRGRPRRCSRSPRT